MKIIELIIDENEELSGVDAVSIVEFPAIESNFVSLNQQLALAKVDDEKRILMGAALIPNKHIYRRNGNDEYYIFFSDETVRKASELFLINSNQNNATLEHQKELKDLSVVESWIVEDADMDKSKKYGLNAPVGSWVVSMKVNNDTIWNDFVKTGKVKGFSIEGYFADKLEMSLKIDKKDMEKKVIIEKIKSLIEKSELKNQKVELETVKVGDYTSKANQIEKDFNDEYKKQILAVQSTVVKYNNMIADVANSFDSEIEIYKSKVKDLGIDYASTPLSKIAEAARKSIMGKPTYFKSVMDKLKSL